MTYVLFVRYCVFSAARNSCEYTVFFIWLHDQDIFKYCETFKEESILRIDICVTPLVCALSLLSDELTDYDGAFVTIDVRSKQLCRLIAGNFLLAHVFYAHSFQYTCL